MPKEHQNGRRVEKNELFWMSKNAASQFDRNYMNQLFNLGYEQGRRGYAWMKYPPGLKQAVEIR